MEYLFDIGKFQADNELLANVQRLKEICGNGIELCSTDDFVHDKWLNRNGLEIIQDYHEVWYRNKLLKKLKQYRFEGFHHYTDINNLSNVFSVGAVVSRNYIQRNDIKFTDGAEQEIIYKTRNEVLNCARFYYKGRTPTLYRNEGIHFENVKPHMPIPVLLLFSEAIVFITNTFFLNGGGGNNSTAMVPGAQEALLFDWARVFERGPMYNENKTALIKLRNAEFNCEKGVSLCFLKKIVFRSHADLKVARILYGDKKCRFEVGRRNGEESKFQYGGKARFQQGYNFLEDYKIEISPNNDVQMDLRFFNPRTINNYKHCVIVTLSDGSIVEQRIDSQVMANIKGNCTHCTMEQFTSPLSNKRIVEVAYFLNGHRSALWRCD